MTRIKTSFDKFDDYVVVYGDDSDVGKDIPTMVLEDSDEMTKRIRANSATMDDSDTYIDASSTIDTMDGAHNFYWDSDSTTYAGQISSRSV